MTDLNPKINQILKVVLINERAGLSYETIPAMAHGTPTGI
jgi:hypothetical protein